MLQPGHGLEVSLCLGLSFPQFFFGPLALGYVHEGANAAAHLPLGVSERAGVPKHGHERTARTKHLKLRVANVGPPRRRFLHGQLFRFQFATVLKESPGGVLLTRCRSSRNVLIWQRFVELVGRLITGDVQALGVMGHPDGHGHNVHHLLKLFDPLPHLLMGEGSLLV